MRALWIVWKDVSLFSRAKMSLFEGIVVLMVLYGCEAWTLDENAWKRENKEINV